MGKRTRSESNDYEKIAKKFKKLERKLLRVRKKRQRSPSSSSDSSSSTSSSSSSSSSRPRSASSRPRSPRASCSSPLEPYNNEDVPAIEYTGVAALGEPSTSSAAPTQSAPGAAAAPRRRMGATTPAQLATGAAAPAQPTASVSRAADSQAASVLPTPQVEQQPVPETVEVAEVDEELLKILGEDPSQTKIYGKEIRPDLAVRFQHIATVGLPKESRKELLQRYLPPANSILIDAPTLNPEIKAAIHEHVFKRDKSIEIRQKQVASVISCIGESLTLLLSEQSRNTAVIQLLMDASKILCDCQNAESLVRRSFILHNLKKGLKEELQTTKIDKFLFSQDLAEKIKATKAINKSGDDLKIAAPVQQVKKINKPPAKNLNWRGPPQTQRPKGNQRTKEPAQKNRRYNSSRPSSRPASTRNSRP